MSRWGHAQPVAVRAGATGGEIADGERDGGSVERRGGCCAAGHAVGAGPGRGCRAGIGWTSLPRLPRLAQPTLILAGDDDPIIPLVNARIMHRLIPRSELHIYHGGHLDLATDAEHLAPVVEAFLTAKTGDAIAAAPDQTRRLRRQRGRAGGLRAHTPGQPADHARPATALPGARSPAAHPLAALTAPIIEPIARAAPGLSGDPVHEPVHVRDPCSK